MMHRSSHPPGTAALILAVMLAAGCQSPAPSSAIQREPRGNDAPHATNVVHVPRDARFSLVFEAFNPGPGSASGEADRSNTDLWLLMHVRALSANDALQIERKHIVRASLLKRAPGPIPFTLDEVVPVSLEANADYEVDIRLYAVKKPPLRVSPENRPDFSIERQLLDAGGTVQVEARFAINRSNDTLAPRRADEDFRGRTLIGHYQLTPVEPRRGSARHPARLQILDGSEAAPVPQDPFLRFRVESMWSPVALALSQLQSTSATPETASQEHALAAEALAATTRETFLKISADEKQASLAAAEALRKSDAANPGQWEEIARSLTRKSQAVTAARSAMEAAQLRAREARQAVEAAASRATRIANAEKIASLAAAVLDNARRATEAASKDLDDARASLRQARAGAEAARLKKEEWMRTEARAQLRLTGAREHLASLTRKAKTNPDDADFRRKLAQAGQQLAEATKASETAASEWRLAQKDQEATLKEVEDRIAVVAQKRLSLAEAEQERQRARAAKDHADATLNGAEAGDPRPAILRARSL